MKKSFSRSAKLHYLLFILSLVFCGSILLVGGLSYTNPNIEFFDLYKIEPFQKFIYSLMPSFN